MKKGILMVMVMVMMSMTGCDSSGLTEELSNSSSSTTVASVPVPVPIATSSAPIISPSASPSPAPTSSPMCGKASLSISHTWQGVLPYAQQGSQFPDAITSKLSMGDNPQFVWSVSYSSYSPNQFTPSVPLSASFTYDVQITDTQFIFNNLVSSQGDVSCGQYANLFELAGGDYWATIPYIPGVYYNAYCYRAIQPQIVFNSQFVGNYTISCNSGVSDSVTLQLDIPNNAQQAPENDGTYLFYSSDL